jgi:predicted nucleic acid-binding protein
LPEYFADSSAILKVYFRELGSAWLRSLDIRSLTLSTLAIPEVASAFARRRREGWLSEEEALALWRGFRRDVRTWALIGLSQPLLSRAAGVLFRTSSDVPLRALDALQLACALEAQGRLRRAGETLTFLTADTRLELAARGAGLAVDNPERHP